ncbi:MAG: hypothetical protein PUK34_07480 [Clostridia bacterium]|nr:hypothetical protein [Clostridia bacterium]
MKDLKCLMIEDYATTPLELTVLCCIKGYLRRIGPGNSIQCLSRIIEPRVVSLNAGNLPLPVRTVVQGTKLAEFVEDAILDSIRSQWKGLSQDQIDDLRRIEGTMFIQTMSVDFIQFLVDAYRCLVY